MSWVIYLGCAALVLVLLLCLLDGMRVRLAFQLFTAGCSRDAFTICALYINERRFRCSDDGVIRSGDFYWRAPLGVFALDGPE